MRRWTSKERAHQAELIQKWRPWEHSTGPRTAVGKAKVARNAIKHGLRSTAWIEKEKTLTQLLKELKSLLAECS